jgi:hypothetical protein
MATFYFQGQCLNDYEIISMADEAFIQAHLNVGTYLNNQNYTIYSAAGVYYLRNSFVVRDIGSDALIASKNSFFTISVCTPIDPPALSSTAALILPAVALIVFWLGRIAGKQR